MADTSSSSSPSIGFVGLLTILFIGLKLTGNVSWSWWWVLSPLWISALSSIGVIVFIVLAAVAFNEVIKRKV
jgi:predicted tellurium resistance membrane protein TerC